MHPERRGSVEEGEITIRIYCIRKESIFNKRKRKTDVVEQIYNLSVPVIKNEVEIGDPARS